MKLLISKKKLLGTCALIVPLLITEQAFAQIDEVVVTARKRVENQQDVPIAITTLTAADFESRNITNIARLDEVAPNITIDATAPISGSSNATSIFIRGVGQTDFIPTSDPGVGVYLDGVYIARSTGGLLDLKDVNSVEILRGPQGTLFGKNTIGGAVNVTTIKPSTDDFFGEAKVTTGRFDRLDFEGAVNVPLSDTLAVRLSGKRTSSDGFGERLLTGESLGGEDRFTLRGSARWQPTDRLTVDIAADYSDADEDSPVTTTISGSTITIGAPETLFSGIFFNNLIGADSGGIPGLLTVPGLPADTVPFDANLVETGSLFTSNGTGPTGSEYEIFGISGTIDYELSDTFSLKSITAYRDQSTAFGRDSDGSPLELVSTENIGNADQFSQEFQLSATFDKLDFVGGVYYLEESGNDSVTVPFAQESFTINADELCTFVPAGVTAPCQFLNIFRIDSVDGGVLFDNTSYAAYAEVGYEVTDRLSVTGGIRWTRDEKGIDATGSLAGGVPLITDSPVAEEAFEKVTPRFIIDYQVNDNLLGYASFSQGFKSGGFNARYGAPLPEPTSFDEETVDSYEVGFKSDFWGGRARVNAAAFFSNYDDIQVVVFDNGIPRTINAAQGEVKGLEIETTFAPDDHWLLQANIGLIDAEYTSLEPAIEGSFGLPIVNPLSTDLDFVNTPDVVFSLGGQYRQDVGNWGDITYRGDLSYRGSAANDAINTAELIQDEIALLSGRITFSPDDSFWTIAVYGTNLTDVEYITSGVADEPGFGLVEQNAARPREWGASFEVKF
ncbi:MAG: TonB-dependent receptor [Litorimonas sp.]